MKVYLGVRGGNIVLILTVIPRQQGFLIESYLLRDMITVTIHIMSGGYSGTSPIESLTQGVRKKCLRYP